MVATDAILAGLTDEQREAVTCESVPLLVLAGAGSGKTRVLTRRIAWQAAGDRLDPRRVLAVTFTRRAAGEVVSRLGSLGLAHPIAAGTFHSLALRQLEERWRDRGRWRRDVLARPTRVLRSILDGRDQRTAPAVAAEITWAKARLVSPENYEVAAADAGRAGRVPLARVAAVYAEYEREKHRRNLLDYDDLLIEAAGEIQRDPDHAAAIRWRFRHLFVDEFQDLNPAQFQLLRAWLGDRRDLTAVGDDRQAIYGYSGADARYLTRFAELVGVEPTTVRLTRNFRSTPEIASVAALVSGDDRPASTVREPDVAPAVTGYESDHAEVAGMAETIRSLRIDGFALRDIAVLARTNDHCQALCAALEAEGVPAAVRGPGPFFERRIVREALKALDRSQADEPDQPFLRRLDHMLRAAEPLAADRQARADRQLLATLGQEFASMTAAEGTAAGFREFLAAELAAEEPTVRPDAVDVLTFHRAKGLEWPAVFVAGLEEGYVPISHARTDAARAEERRLLYVAVTRAERRLFLSWARHRRFGDRLVERRRSSLLPPADLIDDRVERPVAAPADVRASLASAARQLRSGRRPAAAEPVQHALTAWRDQRARAADVPIEAILDDDVIRTLALERPRDLDRLAEITGLGPVRIRDLGAEILDVLSSHPA